MDCIIPLGNCAGGVTVARNTTSNLIKMKDGSCVVIDCGTGIYAEAIRAIKNPYKIIALYFTHLHIDHVADIVSFADSYDMSKQFTIYGPKGIKEIVSTFGKFNGTACPYLNSIVELETDYLKLHTLPNGTNVSCFTIPHTIPCYGYLFEDTNGIRLCCLGDTSGVDLSALGKINILIHEATCGMRTKVYSDHSNAKMAAESANRVDADFLLLTHFSSKITNNNDIIAIREHTKQFTKANVWTLFYGDPFCISKYYNI
ncbi:Zinc phosphodiesterase [Entamoeba marina]